MAKRHAAALRRSSRLRARRTHSRRTLGFESLEGRRLLAVVPEGFTETVVAQNLTSPIAMTMEPSGQRMWVAYQDGRLGVIENDVLLPQVYQLPNDGSGERGFQGIALDPHFQHNGFIYVYYTANSPSSHNRLSRLTVDPTTENTILPGSEVALLDLPLFTELPGNTNPIWHMGGAIHFMPDETIVIQVGDHQNNAIVQNHNTPIGKILRLNKDGSPVVAAPGVTGNPFYNAADTNPPGGTDWNGNAPGDIDWIDYVWASGLRNPFSGDIDPATGRYFVNDVGEGTDEEVNDPTLAGRNFGWPATEGNFPPASFPNFTNPVYTYLHSEDCAITGGAFYSPAFQQFPAQYDGVYFFSKFCAGEIDYFDPANPGVVTTFATQAAFPMNIEVAADGSLYYISRGAGAGGAPGIGTGSIRKIQFAAEIAPQILQDPEDLLVSVGLAASFSASAAGTAPLTYQWQRHNGVEFVNIPGENQSTLNLPTTSITDDGARFRVVATNNFGSDTSAEAVLDVTTDTPPQATIVTPPEDSTYVAGDTINFSATATDTQDGALGPAAMTWQVDFHHNIHSHPFLPPTSGIDSGSFVVPTIGETASDVFFRITLKVTDSAGLTTTVTRDVTPVLSSFTVMTNFGGGQILVDGQTMEAPLTITGVVNIERTLTAPLSQSTPGGALATFVSWLDGETNPTRTISTPAEATAYIAVYADASQSLAFLSDLPFANDPPPNQWGPVERDTSNGEAAAGDGIPMVIQGVGYSKGLGVHAISDVRIHLGAAFTRFQTEVGVDDETGTGGSVTFQVFGDNVPLTGVITRTGAQGPVVIDVNVTGVQQLRLAVGDSANGNGLDHANWANARLIGVQTGAEVKVNFQTANAAIPAGYVADAGLVYGARGGGLTYGWSVNQTGAARDRDNVAQPDQRLDTLNQIFTGAYWELAVPNGEYAVTVSIGDPGFSSTHILNIEGVNYWNGVTLAANQFRQRTLLVTVTDGRLTMDAGASPNMATRPNFIEVIPTAPPTPFVPRLGDFDQDGDGDGNDFLIWQRNVGAADPEHGDGDADEDGDVDTADLSVWRATHIATAAATVVSEPAVVPAVVGSSDVNSGVGDPLPSDPLAGDPANPNLLVVDAPTGATRPLARPTVRRDYLVEFVSTPTPAESAASGLYTDCGCGGGTGDDAESYDSALEELEPDWLDALAAAL